MSHSGWSSTVFLKTQTGTIPTGVPLTIHARYKPASFAAACRVAINWADGSNYFLLGTEATTGKPQAMTTAAGSARTAQGSSGLSTGTWYSLVARFTSTTDRKIFVDGTQTGSDTNSATPSNAIAFNVGARDGGASPANGSIAEVGLWNAALSDEEIAALVFKSPRSIRPASFLHHFRLLDSASRDEMALPATVTGTPTKDVDHPRVYQRRSSGLVVPFTAGGSPTAYTADLTAGAFAVTGSGLTVPTGRLADLDAGVFGISAGGEGANLDVPIGRNASLDPGVFSLTGASLDASTSATTEVSGGKGGFDPYAYKRRKKRKEPIQAFLDKIEAVPLTQAPDDVQAKAEAARIAAEKFLADRTEALRTAAIRRIEAFHDEIRAEIARREEDDEDTDLLLLAA